jgi:hypothetical protein
MGAMAFIPAIIASISRDRDKKDNEVFVMENKKEEAEKYKEPEWQDCLAYCSVDENKYYHILKRLNGDLWHPAVRDFITDCMMDYEADVKPGVYMVKIEMHCEYSTNPENPDPDCDLTFEILIEVLVYDE